MTIPHVQAGQSTAMKASTMNTIIDAANDYVSRSMSTGRDTADIASASGIVFVKNESGASRKRFDILGLDSPIIPTGVTTVQLDTRPTGSLTAFRGVTPTTIDHAGRFAVLLEPLADGAIGRAIVSGVCMARLIVEDEHATMADVTDGDASALTTNSVGSAMILHRHDGPSGQALAIVRIGTPTPKALFFARVASSTQNGPNRWKYDFKEVEKTLPGYGGWTDRANGITGTAYNLIEDRNSLTGTLGNGVSVSSLKTDDAEFELRPIPDGTRVMIMPVTLPNGTIEYWTQYENGIDGGCV